MKKLRTFFVTMFKSLTSVNYYKDVAAAKTTFSIKYFVMMALIFSTLSATRASVANIPIAKKYFAEFVASAKTAYPSGLELTANNNQWTINQPEPYSIANPFTGDATTPMPKNFITFFHDGTIDDLQKLDTLMLVNSKNIISKDNKGFSVSPIENIPNGSFTQQKFNNLVDSIAKLTVYLPYAVVLISLIGAFIYYFIGTTIYILIAALVVLLACVIFGYEANYGKTARLTIHTLTLPAVIELVAALAGYSIPVPFWFFVVNMIFVVVVILNIRKRGEIDQKAAIDHNNTV